MSGEQDELSKRAEAYVTEGREPWHEGHVCCCMHASPIDAFKAGAMEEREALKRELHQVERELGNGELYDAQASVERIMQKLGVK